MDWNSTEFFTQIIKSNKLARQLGCTVGTVSSLAALEEAIDTMADTPAMVMIADSADARANTDISPNITRVKTIYIAIRHQAGDMADRHRAVTQIRELIRQMLTAILPERIRLQNHGIYLQPDIDIHEINEYVLNGCAAAYLQITVNTTLDLRLNPDEWAPIYFDIVLESYDPANKINLIKALKDNLGYSLKDGKALLDNAPSILFEHVLETDHKEIVDFLRSKGATISYRPAT